MESPSKIIVNPVPKSGWEITKSPGIIIIKIGIIYGISLSSCIFEIWSKYFARIKIRAIFIISEGWKFIPP